MAIAAKVITVSTVGIIPGIRRYTAERQPARLVVSLTSADPVQRRELLPVERGMPRLISSRRFGNVTRLLASGSPCMDDDVRSERQRD